MQLKPLPTLATVAILIVGGVAGWRYADRSEDKPAPAPPPVPVTAAAATNDEVPVYLRGIGTVQALNAVEVHPQVGGVLVEVPVTEGQDVKRGDVVALIDPRPLKAALDKAVAQRTQDQAQLLNAQADQQRTAALARSDFASRQQLETQQSGVARLQGAVQADEASIEEAAINLQYATVRSPLDGRVGLRRLDPGNLVQANATGPGILSITQVRPISVVFTLPQTDIQRVRQAMANGPLPVFADPSNAGGQSSKGQLQTPDNAINPGTGTLQFKASFDNADDLLTPGEFVTTRLQVDTARGITIPHEAVQHGQDGLFVFAIKPDKTVERRAIKVALDDGAHTVLQDGVKAGEQVVVAGQSRIGPGTRVTSADPAQPNNAPPGQGTGQSASR